ncbi:MAG: hypothetical protein ACYDD5_12215 [Sulfuricurvum sp.]
MIVTDGCKVFDTTAMIVIDEKANDSTWLLNQQILFNEQSGEYYYFSNANYNAPDNIEFRPTYVNSIKDIDRCDTEDSYEFFINDYLSEFDWNVISSYYELIEHFVYKIEDELNENSLDKDELYDIAEQFDKDKNEDTESFIYKINEWLKNNGLEQDFDSELFENVMHSLRIEKYQSIFNINKFNRSSFELRKSTNGFYLIHQAEHEPSMYTQLANIPVELILKYCFAEQRFENLKYLIQYIPKELFDKSMQQRKYGYLYDSEIALIWGITRQNFSKTYSNPIESQKRVRERQKKIIEIGSTALKYSISEKDIIDLAKTLQK